MTEFDYRERRYCFRLFDNETGLFHGNGRTQNKVGKTWTNIGHVKNHLRLLYQSGYGINKTVSVPPSLMLVTYVESPTEGAPASTLFEDKK